MFSGNPGTGKNHLAAAIGNRLMNAGRSVIVITVADVMSTLHASYDDGKSGEKFLRELCGVDVRYTVVLIFTLKIFLSLL